MAGLGGEREAGVAQRAASGLGGVGRVGLADGEAIVSAHQVVVQAMRQRYAQRLPRLVDGLGVGRGHLLGEHRLGGQSERLGDEGRVAAGGKGVVEQAANGVDVGGGNPVGARGAGLI